MIAQTTSASNSSSTSVEMEEVHDENDVHEAGGEHAVQREAQDLECSNEPNPTLSTLQHAFSSKTAASLQFCKIMEQICCDASAEMADLRAENEQLKVRLDEQEKKFQAQLDEQEKKNLGLSEHNKKLIKQKWELEQAEKKSKLGETVVRVVRPSMHQQSSSEHARNELGVKRTADHPAPPHLQAKRLMASAKSDEVAGVRRRALSTATSSENDDKNQKIFAILTKDMDTLKTQQNEVNSVLQQLVERLMLVTPMRPDASHEQTTAFRSTHDLTQDVQFSNALNELPDIRSLTEPAPTIQSLADAIVTELYRLHAQLSDATERIRCTANENRENNEKVNAALKRKETQVVQLEDKYTDSEKENSKLRAEYKKLQEQYEELLEISTVPPGSPTEADSSTDNRQQSAPCKKCAEKDEELNRLQEHMSVEIERETAELRSLAQNSQERADAVQKDMDEQTAEMEALRSRKSRAEENAKKLRAKLRLIEEKGWRELIAQPRHAAALLKVNALEEQIAQIRQEIAELRVDNGLKEEST